MEKKERKPVSYAVRGVNGHGHFIVWEYNGINPVNEYVGYDKGTYLALYPKRRLVPSRTELRKQDVAISKTRREF